MSTPIPPLVEPPDWARLPIDECDEPLVEIPPGERLRIRPLYAELKIPGADGALWVRAGVRARLGQAAALLPENTALCLFDGYRPLQIQQWLWDNYATQVRAEQPELSENAVAQIVCHFVARPDADPACPPPHRTGGAVDVYLVETKSGLPLPMGTEPDEIAPQSETRYFEENPRRPFTTNRRLLFHAMTGAGFTNYHGEWWHYDFGNQRWANCSGAGQAIYGIPGGVGDVGL